AIGQEGDEDVRFDALFELMIDRPQLQIILQIFKGGLDLDELDIELPQLSRIAAAQIGAQEIATFATPRLAQLAAIEREAEPGSFRSHVDVDQAPCGPRLGARGAELHQQFLASEAHGGDLLEPSP